MNPGEVADQLNSTNELPSPERQQVMLVEYQCAQSSAEHHDNLVWSATYTIWSANLILLSAVIISIPNRGLWPLLIFACIMGIVLTWSIRIFALQFRDIKNQKYARCKCLERQLGMHQHQQLQMPLGRQTRIYFVITELLTSAWLIALALILVSRV